MVNPKFLLLLTTCLLYMGTLYPQTFSIEKVDTGTYPSISLSLRTSDKKQPVKESIAVSENGQNISFNLVTIPDDASGEAARNAGGKQAVCFLIDNSAYTTDIQVSNIKNAIKTALNSIDTNVVVDVCFYNNTTSRGSMNDVSPEFTTDYRALVKDMYNRVWRKDDTYRSVDFYKALYECIEFMSNKKNLPEKKQIIIIGTGNSNGHSPIKLDDCVAKSNGIRVNGIGLNSGYATAKDNIRLACDKLSGKFEEAVSAADITTSIKRFIQTPHATEASQKKEPDGVFYIKYTSVGNGASPVSVKVIISGIEQSVQYNRPSSAKQDKMYIYIGGGAIVVVLIVVSLILVSRKKKKAKEKERLEKQKKEKAEMARGDQAEGERRRQENKLRLDHSTDNTEVTAPAAVNSDLRRTVISGVKTAKLKNLNNSTYNLTNTTTTIGRNTNNTIVINDPTVSGTHAVLTLENGKWYLTDRGSTNGIYVNGAKIARTELFSGMQIYFGKIGCIFEIS